MSALLAPPRSASVRGYVAVVIGTATILVAAAIAAVPGSPSPSWFLTVLAATAITEMPLVMRRMGRQRWGWGLSEAIVAVGMFVLGPGWLALASGGGMYLGRYGRREPMKQAFNAAQHALAAAGASMMAWLIAPDGLHLGAATAGMAFYFVINNALVGIAIARASDRPLVEVLKDGALVLLVGWAANTSLGLAAVRFLDEPWQMALLIFPLIPAHGAYYAQVQRAEEERALRLLFERVSPPDAGEDAVISSILDATMDAFEATRAQIIAARPTGSIRWQARKDRDDLTVLVDEISSTLLLDRVDGDGVTRFTRPFGDLPRALVVPLEGLDATDRILLVVVEDERPAGFSRSDARIAASFAERAAERLRLAQAVERTRTTTTSDAPSRVTRPAVGHLQLL